MNHMYIISRSMSYYKLRRSLDDVYNRLTSDNVLEVSKYTILRSIIFFCVHNNKNGGEI